MADNPKTKLTYFLLEFNTCYYQAAIFGKLHTCDYVKNKHLTHRFNFYQLEVDGKPVGEWLHQSTHAQIDEQHKNMMPPATAIESAEE